MKILVTGAKGFVGRNFIENLKNIRDGKRHIGISISDIYEYDKGNTIKELELFCSDCDFVFNFAGVNRPQNVSEFQTGNVEFAKILLNSLRSQNNRCPVMLASSIQAAMLGKHTNSFYGQSKLEGEKLFFEYGKTYGVRVLVYRFPNLFGKWCRPNYNSVVATVCNAIANDETYTINDRSTELELLYIDDLVNELFSVLNGHEHHCNYDGLNLVADPSGDYCYVPMTHKTTLGKIAELVESFKRQSTTLFWEPVFKNSFEKKLYSTYLSYLPQKKTIFNLRSSFDYRGSFTEFFKTSGYGQFSINISKPGITKGQHWHNTKAEIFLVVSGHGLIQERQVGLDDSGNLYPVREFEVSGDKLQAVYMLPGFSHNIINLSETKELITLIWANEVFDETSPDTYYLQV